MENMGLRYKARGAGVPLWKVAEALCVSEATLTRMLRKPLDEETEDRIARIIEKLQKGGTKV